MRLTVDTNVLVYATDRSSPFHRDAVDLTDRLPFGKTIILLQTLGELANVLKRHGQKLRDIADLIDRYSKVHPLHAASVGVMADAFELLSRHRLSFWDAFLLATAAEADCRTVLSADLGDGMKYGSVEVINPFKRQNRQRLEKALEP